MKVKLEERYRQFYTLDDLERAKTVISEEKADEETAAGWAAYAAQHIADRRYNDSLKQIIEATAHTAKNCRAWNLYGQALDTQDMDVWIDFTARTWNGFIEGGAYLSDIWSIGGDVDLTGRMYSEYYKKA